MYRVGVCALQKHHFMQKRLLMGGRKDESQVMSRLQKFYSTINLVNVIALIMMLWLYIVETSHLILAVNAKD